MYWFARNILVNVVCHILFRVKYENLEVIDKYLYF